MSPAPPGEPPHGAGDQTAAAEEEEGEEEEVELEGGLRLPGALFDKLFDYQQVALKWLWELHRQKVRRVGEGVPSSTGCRGMEARPLPSDPARGGSYSVPRRPSSWSFPSFESPWAFTRQSHLTTTTNFDTP